MPGRQHESTPGAMMGGPTHETVLTSSPPFLPIHCRKPPKTNLNETGAAGKSKFHMEKSFKPVFYEYSERYDWLGKLGEWVYPFLKGFSRELFIHYI